MRSLITGSFVYRVSRLMIVLGGEGQKKVKSE